MPRFALNRITSAIVAFLVLTVHLAAQSADSKVPKLKDSELSFIVLMIRNDTGFDVCTRTAIAFVHFRGKKLTKDTLEQSFSEIQSAYPDESNLAVIYFSEPTLPTAFLAPNSEGRRKFERAVRGLYFRNADLGKTISRLYADGLTDDALAPFID